MADTEHRADSLALADLETQDPQARWRAGAEVYCWCPFPTCSAVKRDREHRNLRVNTGTGLYTCHRCHASGKLRDFWQDRIGPETAPKDRRRAAAVRAILAPPPAPPDAEEHERRPAEDTYAAEAAAFPDSPAASYLEGRGIPADLAAAHGCGYAPSMGHAERVTFPVRDQAGALVALAGRALRDNTGPRQYTQGPKRLGVFNPAALDAGTPMLVEAPIDALSLEACGYPAAALIGTTAPAWLPAALVGRSVYLAFDADPPEPDGTPGAGDRAAAELDGKLRLSRCRRLRPPDPWKDWNEALQRMGREALTAWLSERLSAPGPAAAAVTAFEPVDMAEPSTVPTNVYLPAPAREDLDGAAPAEMLGNDGFSACAHEVDPPPARYPAPGVAGSGELANLLACVRDPRAARYVELLAWREGIREAAERCEGEARRNAVARVARYDREIATAMEAADAWVDGAWVSFPIRMRENVR